MKWFGLLCWMFGLMAVMAEDSLESRSSAGNLDYTSRYAELASAVPPHVNIHEFIATLSSAGH